MVSVFCNGHEFKNIEAVLFDKDGTFVDSNLYWGKLGENRIKAVIDHYALDFKLYDTLCKTIGYNTTTKKLIYDGPLAVLSRDEVIDILVNELKKYTNTDIETVDKIFTTVHEKFLKEAYKYTKLINGSAECFKRLKKQGLKLAVVTSDNSINTIETLKLLDIAEYFEFVIGRDSCNEPKKSGKPALIALQKLGIEPQSSIIIGDAPMDGEMAINAKTQGCILVKTGQTNPKDLGKYTTVVCNDLNDISI